MRKLFYTLLTLLVVALAVDGATRSKKNDIARNLEVFSGVIKELQTNYVDSINVDKSVRTAIDVMLSELDPYTEYIPEEDQEEFKTISTGEYGGIGSYIMQRNGNVYISGPYEGSPAAEAGLRHGDLIVTIDGDTMLGKSHSDVSTRLKGPQGTSVRVGVKRPYVADSMLTFDVVRRKIVIPSVPYYGVVRDNLGLIELTNYNENTSTEVQNALTELLADKRVKAIVLDLRNNGGGLLESAVKILGYFLPKGTEVLRTRGKGLLDEKIYKTTTKPIVPADMPLFVITNGGTASASEITAGALQDLDRAVIVGSRSFGKGLVQATRTLPYRGLLKVTVAKYYIPSGRLIQAIDYSNRNPDGSVGRIPDSLTHTFSTAHGRTVRDGGGIVPDVEVTYPELSRMTYNVVADNWAFDFANRYRAENPTLPAPEDFVVTDSIYELFKTTIDPERFQYDKVCETIVDRLRETARIEGYMNDSLSQQLDLVRRMMHRSLDADLNTNKASISRYLEPEIIERYYYRRGEAISRTKYDEALDTVAAILATPDRIRTILK